MELSSYIPVLVQILVAVGTGLLIVAASHIFGQRAKKNALKDSAYECGVKPEGKPHPRFGVKFYVVAMLFVVFDIELVFMLPLAMMWPEFSAAKFPVLIPAMFFIALMCAGILYEIKKGALDWNIPRSER